MQKKYFYGFNLLLFTMLAATSCKKDKLPGPQPLKTTVSVQETAKVNGSGQNTTGTVTGQVKPDPQPQPWKFMDPQPQPWMSMDPPPQPYKSN